MADVVRYDLLVIGGGAAGLAAARDGVRRGRRTVLVQDGPVGGDCTFTGCVPSKTLIAAAAAGTPFPAALQRVRDTVARIAAGETAEVLRGEGIDVVGGRARFVGPRAVEVGGRRLSGRRVVVATGTAPAVPPIEGLPATAYLTNETVFDLRVAPASLLVLGGGPIGVELAQAFARLGVTVTVVEEADRLLNREEPEASDVVRAALEADGVTVRVATTATRVEEQEQRVRVHIAGGENVTADRLLVAVGRRPLTADLGLDVAGIGVDERGYVRTDERLATTAGGVYAAGDVTGRLLFTHAADEMGRIAASNALRRASRRRFRPESTPWVTFTDPEVARVGRSEAQAVGSGGARVAYLPMTAVDRAVTAGRTEGFVKLIADRRPLTGHAGGGRLVGATVVAPNAGEMIAEITLAIRTGMFTGRLAQTVHAYPTYATGVRGAAAMFFVPVDGRAARPAGSPG